MKIIEAIFHFPAKVFERLKDLLSCIGEFIMRPFAKPENNLCHCEPLSISDYLSRRERTILDLMEQREKEGPCTITLWLGLDGLQLNEDGSTEWVSRRKAEEKSADSGLAQILQNSLNSQIEAMQLQQMRNKLQNVCAYHNANTQYANLQSMIQTQCQNAVLPTYPTYAPLFMTQNTPYWTYSVGGNFGTYRYWQ